MARKTPSRMELRRMTEAAEAQETSDSEGAPKKKAAKKKAAKRVSRAKEKVPERRRLVWGVFSGTMKEEARFPYAERDAALEKAEKLSARGKKRYFVQPVKEVITEPLPTPEGEEGATPKTAAAKKKTAKKKAVAKKVAKKKVPKKKVAKKKAAKKK